MYSQDENRPLISGEFTHWEPVRMLRVDEFARSIDQKIKDKNQNFIEIMRADNLLTKANTTLKFEELDEHE